MNYLFAIPYVSDNDLIHYDKEEIQKPVNEGDRIIAVDSVWVYNLELDKTGDWIVAGQKVHNSRMVRKITTYEEDKLSERIKIFNEFRDNQGLMVLNNP